MENNDHNGEKISKTLLVLFVVFMAIVLSDVTTGTLSLPMTDILYGLIACVIVMSLLVMMVRKN